MTPAFRTDLVAKLIDVSNDESCIWELERSLVYDSAILPFRVEVPRGFKTDFASVPRLPMAYLLTGNTAHRPAVIHDYFYRNHREHEYRNSLTRKIVDEVFYEAMLAEGVDRWRAWLMWSAVRTFGASSWESLPEENCQKNDPGPTTKNENDQEA